MEDDQEYYSRRAQQEAFRAQVSSNERAKAIHAHLANVYLALSNKDFNTRKKGSSDETVHA